MWGKPSGGFWTMAALLALRVQALQRGRVLGVGLEDAGLGVGDDLLLDVEEMARLHPHRRGLVTGDRAREVHVQFGDGGVDALAAHNKMFEALDGDAPVEGRARAREGEVVVVAGCGAGPGDERGG